MIKMAITQSIKGQVFTVGEDPEGNATLTPTQSDEQAPLPDHRRKASLAGGDTPFRKNLRQRGGRPLPSTETDTRQRLGRDFHRSSNCRGVVLHGK